MPCGLPTASISCGIGWEGEREKSGGGWEGGREGERRKGWRVGGREKSGGGWEGEREGWRVGRDAKEVMSRDRGRVAEQH